MFIRTLIIAAIATLTLAGANADPDRVPSLPQMPFDTFDVYSGYLPVSSTRELHYMFLTS